MYKSGIVVPSVDRYEGQWAMTLVLKQMVRAINAARSTPTQPETSAAYRRNQPMLAAQPSFGLDTWPVDKFPLLQHDDRCGGSTQLRLHEEAHQAYRPSLSLRYALNRARSNQPFH